MTVKEETEKPWSFELVNKQELIQAVAKGRVPCNLLAVNMRLMNQRINNIISMEEENDC